MVDEDFMVLDDTMPSSSFTTNSFVDDDLLLVVKV